MAQVRRINLDGDPYTVVTWYDATQENSHLAMNLPGHLADGEAVALVRDILEGRSSVQPVPSPTPLTERPGARIRA